MEYRKHFFVKCADPAEPICERGVYGLEAPASGMQKTPDEPQSVSLDKFQSYRANQTAGRGNVLNQMNHDAMGYSFIEKNK